MDSGRERQMEKTVNFIGNYGSDEQVRELAQRSMDKTIAMAGGAQHGKTALMEAAVRLAESSPDILVASPGDGGGLRGLNPVGIVENEFLEGMQQLLDSGRVMPGLDMSSAKLAMDAMAKATKEAEEKAKKLRKALVPRGDLGVGWTEQVVGGQKPGRNQLCPCGSGMKFKHCCGEG